VKTNTKLKTLVITTITAATLITLSGPAVAATPGKGPGPKGAQFTGRIQDAEDTNWCLTQPVGMVNGSRVFMAWCAEKGTQEYAHQQWHCAKLWGLGECVPVLGEEPLDLGQDGSKLDAAKLINPNNGGGVNYVLTFLGTVSDTKWALQNGGYHNYQLGIPDTMREGHVYPLDWMDPDTARFTFIVRTPQWKEDPF
jgi:hypothetical protein